VGAAAEVASHFAPSSAAAFCSSPRPLIAMAFYIRIITLIWSDDESATKYLRCQQAASGKPEYAALLKNTPDGKHAYAAPVSQPMVHGWSTPMYQQHGYEMQSSCVDVTWFFEMHCSCTIRGKTQQFDVSKV